MGIVAIWKCDQLAGRGGEPLKVKCDCRAWSCLLGAHHGRMFLDSSFPPTLPAGDHYPQCWTSEHLLKAVRQSSSARQEHQALLMKAILGTAAIVTRVAGYNVGFFFFF